MRTTSITFWENIYDTIDSSYVKSKVKKEVGNITKGECH